MDPGASAHPSPDHLRIDAFTRATARTRLRPATAADASFFCDLQGDAAIMRQIGPTRERAAATHTFARILDLQRETPPRCLLLLIEDRVSARALGVVSCNGFDARATQLDIGLILHRRAQGKGLPPEILTAFTESLFTLLPVQEVRGCFHRANKAAERAVRGIGFVLDEAAMAATGDPDLRVRTAWREPWLAWRANHGE